MLAIDVVPRRGETAELVFEEARAMACNGCVCTREDDDTIGSSTVDATATLAPAVGGALAGMKPPAFAMTESTPPRVSTSPIPTVVGEDPAV